METNHLSRPGITGTIVSVDSTARTAVVQLDGESAARTLPILNGANLTGWAAGTRVLTLANLILDAFAAPYADADYLSHLSDTDNPHSVTTAQAGAAPSSHVSDTDNPHEVTAAQAGAAPSNGPFTTYESFTGDDAARSFTPPIANGLILFAMTNNTEYALLRFNTSNGQVRILLADADVVAVDNTALTGTSGPDGKFSISAYTGDGKIYLDNRLGGYRTFRLIIF